MTVILHDHKVAYFAVPKAACTTIKKALFQAEKGISFDATAYPGRPFSIHGVYPTRLFKEVKKDEIVGYECFTVIRDPIERFLSAYRNRVLEKDEISKSKVSGKISELGLPLRPSLSTFISHLNEYRVVRGIDHHVSPMTLFLGRNRDFYSRIYNISQSSEAIKRIQEITGRMISEEVHNSSNKNSAQPDELSAEQLKILKDVYAEDYEVFGDILEKSRS